MVRFAVQTFEAATSPVAKRCRTEETETFASALASIDGDDRSFAALFDPETLDCGVCMEPLCPPIFQCSNGHIACTSCCTKMNNVCPTCTGFIGKIRCLAIEKLIESLHMNCKYAEFGCLKMIKFTKKQNHEAECEFAPCSCPLVGCDHSGPISSLSAHFLDAHQVFTTHIKRAIWCTLSIDRTTSQRLLKADTMLFLLVVEKEELGNLVYMRYFGSPCKADLFMYSLHVKWGKKRLMMQTFPQCAHQWGIRPAEFLLVPSTAYADGEGHVHIDIFIHIPGESHSNPLKELLHNSADCLLEISED